MFKKLFMILICLTFIGCPTSHNYVKKMYSNDEQIVFQHGAATYWLQDVTRQAEAHCNELGKKTFMTSHECEDPHHVNDYAPILRCTTMFECR